MCTYLTEKTEIFGSAKGPQGWAPVDTATVYFDHPFFTPLDHSLNIDFVNEAAGWRFSPRAVSRVSTRRSTAGAAASSSRKKS